MLKITLGAKPCFPTHRLGLPTSLKLSAPLLSGIMRAVDLQYCVSN